MASDLPVDLLEKIFLLLDDAADLARASAACTSYRRAVSNNDRFLRCFRSRHCRRQPVLGLLENRGGGKIGFCPVQSPRRSVLAAGACADAADFTFRFIPRAKCSWRVRDARDSRVLLSRYRRVWYARHRRPPLLVVCDPLHRRHVEIPPIPGHLLDEHADHQELEFEPFLAPAPPAADEEVDEHELSFQVICNALSVTKLVAFAFSSASGQWRAVASFCNNTIYGSLKLKNLCSEWSRQHAHGCFYWTNFSEDFMLVLDTTREMEFFVITDIPHKRHGQSKIIVEAAGEGRLGLLLLLEDKLELYSRAWQGNNSGDGGVVVPEPADEDNNNNKLELYIRAWAWQGNNGGVDVAEPAEESFIYSYSASTSPS